MQRTIRDFTYSGDLWPTVDTWAKSAGYHPVNPGGESRLYQKGHGFLMAPMMLSLARSGPQVHMEAWVRVNLLMRIMAMFIIPTEMGIESGGFKLVLPRKVARDAVNKLMVQLGQQPIP